jgi:hypothetical protein
MSRHATDDVAGAIVSGAVSRYRCAQQALNTKGEQL